MLCLWRQKSPVGPPCTALLLSSLVSMFEQYKYKAGESGIKQAHFTAWVGCDRALCDWDNFGLTQSKA